jgi:hypothetical protein
MKRVMIFALAVLLMGVPAVTLAQTSSSPAAPASGTQDKAADKPADKSAADKPAAAPSASPSTSPPASGSTDSTATSGSSGAGQASPAMPASAEDCKNNGWQKFGAKSEAECAAKVKK